MSALRLPYAELSGAALAGLRHTKRYLEHSTLDPLLREWVNLRVSQLNGCSYCLQLHAASLRAAGETHARIDSLPAWRISGLFSDKEKAALQWTESLSAIGSTQAPDADFAALRAEFSEQEVSDLTFAIALMHALNRVAIAMRQ